MVFSIIVPAFNEEKLLSGCLDSLVSLDYNKNKFEIILVNNNSSDRTKEIALKYSRRGVKVFDEPKQGNVFALIKGCAEAHGEILVFTDADTKAPKNWLKKYEKVYRDKKVVCAGGPGKLRPVIFGSVLPELIINWGGWLTGFASCFNLSIRESVYEKIGGFNPKINFHQDVYLALRAKKIGKFKFLTDNPVITSSRRYSSLKAVPYVLKALVNIITLLFFKKSVFFEFGDVRK